MTGNLAGALGPPDWPSGSPDGNACGVRFGFEDTGIEANSSPAIVVFKSTQLPTTSGCCW